MLSDLPPVVFTLLATSLLFMVLAIGLALLSRIRMYKTLKRYGQTPSIVGDCIVGFGIRTKFNALIKSSDKASEKRLLLKVRTLDNFSALLGILGLGLYFFMHFKFL